MISTRTTFAVIALASGSLVACGPSAPAPSAPPAGSARPAAGKPAEPPAAKLADLTLGSTKLAVEECPLDPPLSSDKIDPIQSIARAGDHVYIADGTAGIRVYAMKPGCKLALDTSIGEGGVLKAPAEIGGVTADGKGTVIASNGVFGAHLIQGGKVVGPCGSHYVGVHPSGAWALSSFVGADVQKITVSGATCTAAPWVLTSMADDAKRAGPLKSVSSIGFMDDLALVGGLLAGKETRVVIGFDAAGKEKLRVGSDKPAAEDGFGWVHAVAACGPGLCVADANYRAISVWSKDGKFVGRVKLDEIIKTGLPWAQTVAPSGGDLLVGVSVRPDKGAKVGKILRLAFR